MNDKYRLDNEVHPVLGLQSVSLRTVSLAPASAVQYTKADTPEVSVWQVQLSTHAVDDLWKAVIECVKIAGYIIGDSVVFDAGEPTLKPSSLDKPERVRRYTWVAYTLSDEGLDDLRQAVYVKALNDLTTDIASVTRLRETVLGLNV